MSLHLWTFGAGLRHRSERVESAVVGNDNDDDNDVSDGWAKSLCFFFLTILLGRDGDDTWADRLDVVRFCSGIPNGGGHGCGTWEEPGTRSDDGTRSDAVPCGETNNDSEEACLIAESGQYQRQRKEPCMQKMAQNSDAVIGHAPVKRLAVHSIYNTCNRHLVLSSS